MLTEKNAVAEMIRSGETLMLSGTEEALTGLPKGNWVGGTSSYFMCEDGGQKNLDKIFVMRLPEGAKAELVKFYDSEHLLDISENSQENGFTYLLIPFGCEAHFSYAQSAPQFTEVTIGWISGVALEDIGKKTAKVFNGQTGQISESEALAMHCSLPKGKCATISIINIYQADTKTEITFPNSGFEVSDCFIDGKPANIVDYIKENNIDTKAPMVTHFRFGSSNFKKAIDPSQPMFVNYGGNYVNISFASIKDKQASLYAPIFKGVKYYFAKPVNDYMSEYQKQLTTIHGDHAFSFSCILNYTNSNLEGEITKGMYGPFTFGEIAYQLLNQTLVYLEIK
jgi:hypothetical protein